MARKRRTYRSASSAASGWGAAQKNAYAKMNAANSRSVATNRARSYSAPVGSSRTGSGLRKIGGTPQWELFGKIGNRLRNVGR